MTTSTFTSEVDSFLMGSGGRSAKFLAHNDQVWGVVMSAEVRQQTDFTSGDLLFWDDGKPRMQLVVTLLTEEREDEDDDGLRRVYIKGQMTKAVAEAVRKAGAKGIREGGRLVVRYVDDIPPAKRGLSPTKKYVAKYESPTQEVQVPDEPDYDEDGVALPF
jgi:hypothetical protein